MITYVVIDIEADGPIPGPNSMISLGAVAINKKGYAFGEFEPVNYGETETDFYKNYYSDDIVNMTDAKGKIHKYINQAGVVV